MWFGGTMEQIFDLPTQAIPCDGGKVLLVVEEITFVRK